MVTRSFWQERIDELLRRRSILWLAGVRRTGKTTLCMSMPDAEYLDCELPRVRRALEDPEVFFRRRQRPESRLVLDEIHRLPDPSQVLKIAADHFPEQQVVATGSSTLAARRKFSDTLAGRKSELWLVPSILADLRDFGVTDLDVRMLHGGLPGFLLGSVVDEDFREWIDSYWAKDLQELFVVDKKASFMRFLELLLHQSGDLFEATAFAAPCEVSRQTIQNYLGVLETTLVATVLRPFTGGKASEIKSQPKVYGFDTGFVCYFRSWDHLRQEDRGHLLEHLVLTELFAHLPRDRVFFWRDKQHHEVDFVIKRGRGAVVHAIECKTRVDKLDSRGLRAFRRAHPRGENLVVCLDLLEPFAERMKEIEVRYVPFMQLDAEIARLP